MISRGRASNVYGDDGSLYVQLYLCQLKLTRNKGLSSLSRDTFNVSDKFLGVNHEPLLLFIEYFGIKFAMPTDHHNWQLQSRIFDLFHAPCNWNNHISITKAVGWKKPINSLRSLRPIHCIPNFLINHLFVPE